jgi:hypothetical protein
LQHVLKLLLTYVFQASQMSHYFSYAEFLQVHKVCCLDKVWRIPCAGCW